MSWFTKDIKSMDDLFVHTLQDIYYAENKIVESLPVMIDKATDPRLKQGFQLHLMESKNQIKRLEQVFQMINVEIKSTTCPAIDGIIDEANEIAGDIEDKLVLDAALVGAAQAVEHYEISRYGTLIAWAKMMSLPECAKILQQTLDEEKATDMKLSNMAETSINKKAA